MGAKENIIKVLISAKKPMQVKDIAGKLDISGQSVRNYLSELKEEGAPIESHKKGKAVYYDISNKLEDRILASEYEFLRTTSKKPMKIDVAGKDYKLAFANTLYAGAKTDKTLFQNFLKYCEGQDADALIITGNTFYMDSMRFSKYAVDRARITEQPKKANGSLFMDLEERLELSRSLLTGLFKDKGERPLYSGPVYVIFGEVEENLVRQHTGQLVKYMTFQERAKLQHGIRALRNERKKARKKKDDEAEYRINHEILDVQRELAKTTMSNLDKNEVKKVEQRVLGFLVNYIESTIPNSTVIPAGEAHFKVGDRKVKVKYLSSKNSNAPSDNLMSSLLASERRQLASGKKLEDLIVQGGLSTTFTQNLLPYMSPEGERTATLVQLPTCLDRVDLEQKLKHSVLAKDPLTHLASQPDFSTGAVIVQYVNGIEKTHLLQGGFLTNPKIDFEDYTPEMFYEMNISDEHYGSSFMTLIETKNDVVPAMRMAYRFVDKNELPIVRINHLGDALQEKNYDTEAEAHPEHLGPAQLEKALRGQRDPGQIIKMMKLNEYRAGIFMPEKQLEAYVRELPLDLVRRVIENSDEAGLVGPRYLMIPGNHTMHTFEGLMNPEKQIAQYLMLMLGVHDDDIISCPIMGKIGFYEGEFGVKDGYLYAESNVHKHGSSKYKDPMRVVRRTYGQMGRPSSHSEDKFSINRSGHTHFGGETSSTDVHHIQCFCFQDSNQYGIERQYPSPTAKGFKINGYPAKGPLYGPIMSINIPITYLAKWAQKEPLIDTDKLFGDSIV
ncbi:helix-turn-helix domain-containing protein [Candidatus Woesearchaeota archaeon]|nr:helix-turn-helix domain-containing protein [Candidatus Woesearchaeota archaeon]